MGSFTEHRGVPPGGVLVEHEAVAEPSTVQYDVVASFVVTEHHAWALVVCTEHHPVSSDAEQAPPGAPLTPPPASPAEQFDLPALLVTEQVPAEPAPVEHAGVADPPFPWLEHSLDPVDCPVDETLHFDADVEDAEVEQVPSPLFPSVEHLALLASPVTEHSEFPPVPLLLDEQTPPPPPPVPPESPAEQYPPVPPVAEHFAASLVPEELEEQLPPAPTPLLAPLPAEHLFPGVLPPFSTEHFPEPPVAEHPVPLAEPDPALPEQRLPLDDELVEHRSLADELESVEHALWLPPVPYPEQSLPVPLVTEQLLLVVELDAVQKPEVVEQ